MWIIVQCYPLNKKSYFVIIKFLNLLNFSIPYLLIFITIYFIFFLEFTVKKVQLDLDKIITKLFFFGNP